VARQIIEYGLHMILRALRNRQQRRRFLSSLLLFAIVLAAPLAIGWWIKLRNGWHCSSLDSCDYSTASVVILASLGAIGLSTLIWWWVSELTGLTQIFEVPWFGIGDDVDSVGMVECIVRAAVFAMILWICIGSLAILAFQLPIKDTSRHPTDKNAGSTGQTLPLSGQPIVSQLTAILQKLNALEAEKTRPSNTAAAAPTLGQTQELVTRLQAIIEQLEAQQRELIASNKSSDEYLEKYSKLIETSSKSADDILTQLKALNIRLDKATPSIEKSTREPHQLIGEPQSITESCFTLEPASTKQTYLESRNMTLPMPQGTYASRQYRTIASRPVFFDRGSPVLSDWAEQDIAWFLNRSSLETSIAIYGSTDPQGSDKLNQQLAQDRMQAIGTFIQSVSHSKIIHRAWHHGSGAPKSEPYKRVSFIRLLEPCQ
jgi:outer membrane protein OmpA-like peptidoglycan-associated protein